MGSGSESQPKAGDAAVRTLEQNTDKLSCEDTISLFSILAKIDKLSRITTINPETVNSFTGDIVSALDNLLRPKPFRIVRYFLQNRAATGYALKTHLDIPSKTVYRTLNLMKRLGLISLQTQVQPAGRMKRKATIWGLHDCSIEQRRAAYQHHLSLLSPVYQKADRLTKAYIENGGQSSATQRELINHLKGIGIPPRDRWDLANMMGTILRGGP